MTWGRGRLFSRTKGLFSGLEYHVTINFPEIAHSTVLKKPLPPMGLFPLDGGKTALRHLRTCGRRAYCRCFLCVKLSIMVSRSSISNGPDDPSIGDGLEKIQALSKSLMIPWQN